MRIRRLAQDKVRRIRGRAPRAGAELRAGRALDAPPLASQIDALINVAQQGNATAVRRRLQALVPEYRPEEVRRQGS